MKRINGNSVGIDSGEKVLFSDFENGGEMWTGSGPRERRNRIEFSARYKEIPTVQASLALWDVDNATVMRADIRCENISEDGFDLVFRTWGDTRIARVRAAWMSIGPLSQKDDWDLY
ncbi:MAG: H-type lectin domain-containing protein [Sulfitobacter sp.]|jgi:H-type lectin domain-containing protein|uniref:H-type lectin domain-containing protein n=3 Tax=Sulfitobacter sp. TaxID=1903071 RepID=UPI0026BC5F20|tara:strand:+ start:2034 stop:2384 length:351 start_codon:yes stop_codon:yes gene_type:complete